MANIPFKSITFPGLPNKYTVPEISNDLMTAGKAADAKATGDALSALEDQFSEETDKLKADLAPLKGNGLTPAIKSAMLACFRGLPYMEGQEDLYDALYDALYTTAPIDTRIVYEIPHGTDISTWSIDTGQHAYTLDEDFTFLAKVTTDTAGTSMTGMFLLDSLSTVTPFVGPRVQANMSNGNLTFRMGFNGADDQGGVGGTGSGVYDANEVHTVVFVLRNNNKSVTAKCYVDGIVNYQNTATLQDKTTEYPETYYVGKIQNGIERPWQGVVDIYRIYNEALTDTEIASILNV